MKKICLFFLLVAGISYGADTTPSNPKPDTGISSWINSGISWVTKKVEKGITEGASSVAAKTVTKVVGGIAINEAEINKNKKKIEETTQELKSVKKDTTDTKAKLESIEKDNTDTKAKLESVKKDNADTKTKLESVKKDNADTKTKLESVKKDTTDTKTKLESVKKDNAEIKNRLENKVDRNEFSNATNEIKNNAKTISALNSKIDKVESKFNKGLSLMAAMSSLDFGTIPNHNDVVVAAAIGNYAGNQAVAIGLAMEPTDRFGVNLKYSVSSNDINTSAIGVGARYRFSF